MTDQTQTTTEPVLLPCPFCGGEADRMAAMGESWGRCMTCNATTEMFGTDTAAIAAWNTRTTPQPLAIGLDREAAQKALMSYLFGECQPDRGDIFGWVDDRSGEIIDFIISKAANPTALSPPAEVPFAAEDACLACNSPAPVDHIGDATEKVDWARCQRCGGEIQGWICQQCHQEFEENDAGELVFCPSEGVDWERVGPKLVEALERIAADGEPYRNGYCQTDIAIDPALTTQEAQDVARAALAAAQPEGK